MNPGKIIKAFREKMDLSQESVASFLGIPREMISYYENNSREIPLDHLEKLSNLFGVGLEEFFEENEDQAKTNVAFAFRADEISTNDLEAIASFRKVIKNYLKLTYMKK